MRDLKNFLETSTIHGLQYISTTKNVARLLWTFVVFSSFMSAAYIISLSYKSWKENPITTTVDILPMSQIKFPKVTVCPPRETYTNLNYDITQAEKRTLDIETREMLTDYSLDVIQEALFDRMLTTLNKIQEKDKYYNLYRGYSKFHNPYYQCDINHKTFWCYQGLIYFQLDSSVTSGSISTFKFGKSYNKHYVINFIDIQMKIFVPESLINMNNTVLYVELETYPENNHGMTFGKEIIKQRMFTRNISNPVGSYNFNYQANYSPDDLKNFTLVEVV